MALIYTTPEAFVSGSCVADGDLADQINLNKGPKHIYTELITVDSRLGSIEAWKTGEINVALLNGKYSTDLNTASTIISRDASGNFSAGTITAALNGNANTATKLQTARTINNVSFNGTANIIVEPYVERDDSTNATRYLAFVDSNTAGNQRLNLDTDLNYNPSTNVLSTTCTNALNLGGTTAANFSLTTHNHDSLYLKLNGTSVMTGDLKMNGKKVFMGNDDYFIYDDASYKYTFYYNGLNLATVKANVFEGTATTARYADLAEKYKTDTVYEIGTVLGVDSSDTDAVGTLFEPGKILLGVVSDKPGCMLNAEADGQYVALKGMIPVKCDDVIRKGQYCIASESGKCIGINKNQISFLLSLDKIGVAIEDSKDGLVLVKV